MKHQYSIYFAFLALIGLLSLTACNRKVEEIKSDYQIKNEKYVERISKDASYRQLPFPGSLYFCYYKQLKAPTAPMRHPFQNSEVSVRYVGRTIDGQIFDGEQYVKDFENLNDDYVSDNEAIKMDIYTERNNGSAAIEGFQIVLQNMAVGEKGQVVIPWQLAYGSNEINAIPAYSALIFDIELVDILKQ